MAGRLGVLDWSLEIPSEEQVAAADQAGRGSDGDVAYLLPRHPAEIHRLDVQHHALREQRGASYGAPVRRPGLILDVGTGSGQWAYELCQEFPEALVIGLDLVPSTPGAPANYRGVRANVLQGLSFRDDRFDFVHQRLMFSGVPVRSWPALVAELVRIVRPGGWIELVEGATEFLPRTPAMEQLSEMLRKLNRARGLDSTSTVFRRFDAYLKRAGAREVERRTVALPPGEWGGRVGSLMASDIRAFVPPVMRGGCPGPCPGVPGPRASRAAGVGAAPHHLQHRRGARPKAGLTVSWHLAELVA